MQINGANLLIAAQQAQPAAQKPRIAEPPPQPRAQSTAPGPNAGVGSKIDIRV
jgi:hypothetical protein